MTNSENVLLEVRDAVVCYGRIEALHGVSITVREGELVTLLGSNGAGKTTLMRAISGLRPLSSGSVRFDGRDITRVKAYRRAIDGSSRSSTRGRAISARPIASICCSPPDSVPPTCLRRSASRGNVSNTQSSRASWAALLSNFLP